LEKKGNNEEMVMRVGGKGIERPLSCNIENPNLIYIHFILKNVEKKKKRRLIARTLPSSKQGWIGS